VWLGLMLFATGVNGLVALWTAAAFFVPLVVIGSLTRTVSLRLLGWLILMGGVTMAVAYLGGSLFSAFISNPDALIRNLVIPPMEEILKLAPVLFIVWRRRRSATWSFGATDLLLMGAAAGLGFGIVEDAYVRNSRFGWPGEIGLLPITELTGGTLVVGHAIWTAVAGATVGLGLMVRHRRRLAILVGISGIAWTTLDHIRTNTAPTGRDSASAVNSILTTITADGWLSLWIFVALVVATILVDAAILWRFPRLPGLSLSLPRANVRDLTSWWGFRIRKRALAYTYFRATRSPTSSTDAARRVAYALAGWLLAQSRRSSEPPPPIAVSSP
jgi:RsiW-degrading membrane proteinase PrsW (M82 family)